MEVCDTRHYWTNRILATLVTLALASVGFAAWNAKASTDARTAASKVESDLKAYHEIVELKASDSDKLANDIKSQLLTNKTEILQQLATNKAENSKQLDEYKTDFQHQLDRRFDAMKEQIKDSLARKP